MYFKLVLVLSASLRKPIKIMLISMQKISFMTHLFLEILQKYCILVILSTLEMHDQAQQM